ncbi:hypothetical protein [Sorangium sp. So ce1099]|uniref:hypothetical protein n=1 Tax=Sorangium sp. So ce1099 TaxID=3133331 RepID=UPI003F6094BD
MRYLRQLFVSAVLTMAAVPVGCGPEAPGDAEQASDGGSISLALVAGGSSGAVYRLSNAWFELSGPTHRRLHGDGDATEITEVLPVGRYDVMLEPGWVLERWSGAGYVPVEAGLTSPNPLSIVVRQSLLSTAVFTFWVTDDVVSFDQGTLGVVVAVDDVTPAREDAADACNNRVDEDVDGLVDCADPDCQVQPFCTSTTPLIDDFEDGDFADALPRANSFLPFIGPWATYSDGTIPWIEMFPVAGPASPTALGISSPAVPSGSGAGVALTLDVWPADASAFEGIRFKIRSQASPVRFEVGMFPIVGNGCSPCDRHGVDLSPGPEWATVEVRWSELEQEGWSGGSWPFEPWSIVDLRWHTPAGQPVGFEIDDVELF